MMVRVWFAVIVCPKCQWTGEKGDLAGNKSCPRCGERKFSDWPEVWLSRLSWAFLLGLAVYAVFELAAK